MTPLFMVVRNDGKTDNIFEADFKKGVFIGDASKYKYEDITVFHLPKDVVEAMTAIATKTKDVKDVKEFE